MQRAKQWGIGVILAICIVAVACVDTSAPKGPASISLLQLPSLFIVKGDTMRDTNGVAMAPSVIAFDAAGDTLRGVAAQFFITDSLPVAHFANGKLVGDTLGIVHVVGQIGSVQTPAAAIPVTLAPASISTTLTGHDSLLVPVGPDSASSIGSLPVSVFVHAADNLTGIPGVLVSYALTRVPNTSSAGAVYLTDRGNAFAGALSSVDTTDASGTSQRHVAANARFLAKTDSLVIVTISARYKGALLQGAPLVDTIRIKTSFSLQ